MFLRVRMVVNFLRIFVNMSVTRQDTCLTDLIKLVNTTARGFLRPILTMNSLYHRDAMQILCYITCTLTMYLYRSEYIFSICKFMKYVL